MCTYLVASNRRLRKCKFDDLPIGGSLKHGRNIDVKSYSMTLKKVEIFQVKYFRIQYTLAETPKPIPVLLVTFNIVDWNTKKKVLLFIMTCCYFTCKVPSNELSLEEMLDLIWQMCEWMPPKLLQLPISWHASTTISTVSISSLPLYEVLWLLQWSWLSTESGEEEDEEEAEVAAAVVEGKEGEGALLLEEVPPVMGKMRRDDWKTHWGIKCSTCLVVSSVPHNANYDV